MADIFISYANEDRESAAQLAQMLEAVGWRIWWDRRIPAGRTWRSVLEDALREMRCMVVLWSHSSVDSPWVTEEAEEARRRGKTIVPVLIQAVEPPIGFRAIQAADLAHWDGTAGDPAAQMFIADLKTVLGTPLAKFDQRSSDLETQKIAEGFSLARMLSGDWRKLALAAAVAAALFAGWQFWLDPRQKIQTPPPSLMGLAITGERQELKPSDTVKLRLTANYSDGQQRNINDGIEWSSSAPGVATITKAGEVTARTAGTADITAKIGNVSSSGWQLSVTTVGPRSPSFEPVKLVDLDISSANKELFTSERAPIRVRGRYSDNTEKPISDGLQWHLSDPALASVNANGELMALRPGKVEVSARFGDRQSSPLTFLIKESPKAMPPQVKPDKPYEPRPVKAPAATEQTRARIAAAISRAGSFRGQGNYAAALVELEKAKAIDNSNEEIRKEIEQTRRACKAEVVLGNKINC
jgi:hypothetical protein